MKIKDLTQGVAEGSGGNWYIRVNGKILNDTKFKPVIFSSKDEARSHAMKLADKKRIPLSQMKLTKSWMDAPEPGVAEGAPIVVMPRADRLKKAEPTKVRYQGDIVPPTKPPSTEKRGVKGRPGQRPMPDQGVADKD